MLLEPESRRFLLAARRAVLATSRDDGRARLVPICLAALDVESGGTTATVVYSPLDEKPKRSADVHRLGRVRDIAARPVVSLLVDRWDEDWTRLAWLRLDGTARLVEPDEPEHAAAIAALRGRYPQYAGQALERLPLIAVDLASAASWGKLG